MGFDSKDDDKIEYGKNDSSRRNNKKDNIDIEKKEDSKGESDIDISDDEYGDSDSYIGKDTGTGMRRRTLSSIKKYIITVAAIVGVFVIVSGALVLAYSNMRKYADNDNNEQVSQTELPFAEHTEIVSDNKKDDVEDTDIVQNDENEDTDKPSVIFEETLTPPRKTYVLIIGTDQSGLLADVQIVACYDYVRQEVNFISIPRDTYVELSKTDVNELKAKGRNVPSDGVMKINELHAYAGSKEGHIYIQRVIEGMLSIELDYYTEIDLKAFRYIVDAVGGIDMQLRPEGYKYSDPEQNLYINLPGGFQHLDGKAAEHLVRFRDDYRNGDLDRIPVQQEFMKEFFKQVMNKESIMSNIADFYAVCKDYVKTDFGVDRFLIYAEAITQIKPENISFNILPGSIYETVRNGVDCSYYKYNPTETMKMVSELFNNFDESESTIESESSNGTSYAPVTQDLKKMKIQVLNGGSIEGKAASVRDALRAEGYTVTGLGNYNGMQKEETRIMLRYDVDAENLKNFFENSVIEIDSSLKDTNYDIVIIIGTEEK